MEVVGATGSMCFCPDGWIWTDGNRTECVACTGGAVADGDLQSLCPNGTAWIDNACQAAQAPPIAEVPQTTCTGGAVATDQGCQCTQGTVWDGSNCFMAPAAPQPIEIRQSTQSFTCCINHANFTCPDRASFTSCATMSATHGCKPAGRC